MFGYSLAITLRTLLLTFVVILFFIIYRLYSRRLTKAFLRLC